MKLQTIERLFLGQILPQKGNLMDMTISAEIQEKLKVTSTELSAVGYEELGEGRIGWDTVKDAESTKDFKLTSSEITFLKKCVEKLSESESITQNVVDLCIKINKLQ